MKIKYIKPKGLKDPVKLVLFIIVSAFLIIGFMFVETRNQIFSDFYDGEVSIVKVDRMMNLVNNSTEGYDLARHIRSSFGYNNKNGYRFRWGGDIGTWYSQKIFLSKRLYKRIYDNEERNWSLQQMIYDKCRGKWSLRLDNEDRLLLWMQANRGITYPTLDDYKDFWQQQSECYLDLDD
jgi:hypothetical protein